MAITPTPDTRRSEIVKFVFLAFVLVPVLSVGVVATYGFAVWMYQLVAGPPTM